MRIGDHQQVELLQALQRFRHARDACCWRGPARTSPCTLSFWSTWSFGSSAASNQRVERDAGRLHRSSWSSKRDDQIVVVDLPDARPVLPGAFDEAVVERQRHDIEADVGRALHVVVAAEDVGAGAGPADIAGGQQQRCSSRARWRCRPCAGSAPMHQISVDGFCVANISATRLSCSPGTPVTRSTSSGVHFSTSLRMSSMP